MTIIIEGRLIDKNQDPLGSYYVEARYFGTDGFAGKDTTGRDGSYSITLNPSPYLQPVIIRLVVAKKVREDDDGYYAVVHRTSFITINKSPTLYNITVKNKPPYDDPYEGSWYRMATKFASVQDTLEMDEVNMRNELWRLTRLVNSWWSYTNPLTMPLYGYPGPQVPRRPVENPHSDIVPWRKYIRSSS